MSIQPPGQETVGGQLKAHGHAGGENRRHTEQKIPHQRQNRAHQRAVLPAAHQPAQQHGQVHGQQHAADLRNLAGQKRQHQPGGHKQRRQRQVLHLRAAIFSFHQEILLPGNARRAGPGGANILYGYFTTQFPPGEEAKCAALLQPVVFTSPVLRARRAGNRPGRRRRCGSSRG